MAPLDSDLFKADANPKMIVTNGDLSTSVTIKDSTINKPEQEVRGLTNLGAGAVVAAGIPAASYIVAKAALCSTAKLVIMTVGGLQGCLYSCR